MSRKNLICILAVGLLLPCLSTAQQPASKTDAVPEVAGLPAAARAAAENDRRRDQEHRQRDSAALRECRGPIL